MDAQNAIDIDKKSYSNIIFKKLKLLFYLL